MTAFYPHEDPDLERYLTATRPLVAWSPRKTVVYVDIDGTMTDLPMGTWGTERPEVIAKVRRLIEEGHDVIIWSGAGRDYAERWAAAHNLQPLACLAKPDLCVDDSPTIRHPNNMPIVPAERFMEMPIGNVPGKAKPKRKATRTQSPSTKR
jgi:hypothetical protein